MIKVLFICHGNICRSPMAQYIFQRQVDEAGLGPFFEIDSAATSSEEIGNGVYPPAVKILNAHGIRNTLHRARRMSAEDYRHFDLIMVMDRMNLRNARLMTGNDPEGKVGMLLGDEEIDDPWYTGDFAGVYSQLERGCRALLKQTAFFHGFSCIEKDMKVFEVYSALFGSWCRQTCAPRMQDGWTAVNRTLGQCSVTSFLVQDILGGRVLGTAFPDGNTHCFNEIDGKIYDLTNMQIENSGQKCNYEAGTVQDREKHFAKAEKLQRYLLLKERYEREDR